VGEDCGCFGRAEERVSESLPGIMSVMAIFRQQPSLRPLWLVENAVAPG
jgi:hypothetical protein